MSFGNGPQNPFGGQPPPGYPPPGYPPQGYFPPQPPPPKRGFLKTAGIAVAVLSALCCIGGIMKSRGGGAASSPEARQYVNQDCLTVANTFSNNTRLSDIQRDALWDQQYKGRWVRWTATVNLVQSGTFGGYTVQFKCSPNSLIMDGTAHFGDDQRAALMQYQQGSAIAFEGKLGDHGQFIGIDVDDATVIGR